jgi:hypothetical protein
MIRRGAPRDAQSFDDAWASGDRSRAGGEVDELVRTAELLCRSAVMEPSVAFRSDLRERLMAEAAEVLVAGGAPVEPVPAATTARPRPARRRLAGVAAAAVAAVGTVGMVSSSATAVPGDVLYPVKRGVESVQLAMHRSDTSRGEFQLGQARERLAEAHWLDANDHDDQVAETLEAFNDQAAQGSESLFASYDEQSSAETIDAVNDFAADATVTLATMSEDLPADARAALDLAADTITGLASRASLLCSSCAPADLGSLVDAVDEAVAPTQTSRDTASQSADEKSSSTTTAPPAATTGSSGADTAPSGAGTSKPSAAPSTKAPSLTTVTDPLLGGLLGDEDHEGLVPGLLNGLLGGGK